MLVRTAPNDNSVLQGLLPAPKHSYKNYNDNEEPKAPVQTMPKKQLPAYPNRKGFVPLAQEDFGDGGAYPEIHIVQYPLNMGKPGQRSTALIPVQVDDNGKIRTDLIVKQGGNRNKMVQSQMSDIKEKMGNEDKLTLPQEKEERETAERTKAALEALLNGKIKSSKPSTVVATQEIAESTYIRYTPNPNAPGYSESAKQRVIKMVEAQVDPMEPPKHKHMKVPRGPPTPPVPVLHSPPRKITIEDQQAWKVPPCISNWKNARGFIIPLDKRLAADGRGLTEVTINNKFAMLSEALYISERKATEDLKYRHDINKQLAMREKAEREENLREMANRARLERSGVSSLAGRDIDDGARGNASAGGTFDPYSNHGSAYNEERNREFSERNVSSGAAAGYGGGSRPDRPDSDEEEDVEGFAGESEEDKIARQQRERVRMERRKERERELRLDNMKGNMRKNKADRDEGRDISEKIALGLHKGSGKMTAESMYDSRLFNQSSGMDSGFGGEDEYNTYTKPLFERGEASNAIYRPKKNDGDIYGDVDTQLAKLSDTSRFRPDKGFQGADAGSGAGPRDAPVQFEKAGESRGDRHRDRDSSYHRSSRDDDDRGHDRHSGGGRDGGRDYDRKGELRESTRYEDREESSSSSKKQRREYN